MLSSSVGLRYPIPLGWQPPQAGTYTVRVVDDHGNSASRALRVSLVE